MTVDSASVKLCKYTVNECICSRKVIHGEFCPLHSPEGSQGRSSEDELCKILSDLIHQQDGKWDGFIFPAKFSLGGNGKSIEYGFPISAKNATFRSLLIKNVAFKNVSLEHSSFLEDVHFTGISATEYIHIQDSTFHGNIAIDDIIVKDLNANGSHFKRKFRLTGKISGQANFNGCIFEESVTFSERRYISLSVSGNLNLGRPKKGFASHFGKERFISFYNNIRRRFPFQDDSVLSLKLFYGETHLESAIFKEPKNVLFKGVDLSRARFLGTDCRDVKFIGVNFYQPRLGRNGLFDDVWLRGVDYNTKKSLLPFLEYTYRYIRFSLEAVRDYASANDFYVGEMDAARNRMGFLSSKLFSILAIYNIISRYGTSPWRAFGVFAFFTIMHSLVVLESLGHCIKKFIYIMQGRILIDNIAEQLIALFNECIRIYSDVVFYSLQVMTLQKGKMFFENVPSCIEKINIIFSIIGPILIFLIVLSFRGKIKRH